MSAGPIICVDFDGVIHSYDKGWQNGHIYGELVPGFLDWAAEMCTHFQLVVYSSRSKTPDGIAMMMRWIYEKARPLGWEDTPVLTHATPRLCLFNLSRAAGVAHVVLRFAHEKPAAFMTIDDRAVCFRGDWKAQELNLDAIQAFKSWNNRT